MKSGRRSNLKSVDGISGMNRECVWITRTEPGASASARRFQNAGFKTVIAPLMTISPAGTEPTPPDADALLIITSQNGARHFAELTDRRHWPVLTVGDATANYVRRLGFDDVRSASGTWVDIVRLVKDHIPTKRPINHICGASWRGPLVETLNDGGYDARRIILYQTDPVAALPDIDLGRISHVALFSPKAARLLNTFSPDMSRISAVSISAATDQALGGLRLKARLIADYPAEIRMLAALGA